MWRLIVAVAAVLVVSLSRLAHIRLVWVEEAYGMAAAAELLRGKHLYSEMWFDKPPLYAWFYALCGAQRGWPLRLLDVAFVLLAAWLIFRLGRKLWGPDEGVVAGVLTCFFLTFWIPATVMAVTPDTLMLVPQTVAVLCATQGWPSAAGLASGAAVLCHPKGLYVLPVVLLWTWRSWWKTLAGFAVLPITSLLVIPVHDYWREVWWWGSRYSADTFVRDWVREGLVRTASWAGFHIAAVIGTLVFLWRERDWKLTSWLLVSLCSVAAGWRFFPRYYFAVLPALCLLGARGLLSLPARCRVVCFSLLLIPAIRFGPRYLRPDAPWSDTALMDDSRSVAAVLHSASESGDSVLVWGYRPDVFVYSGLPAGTRFLDSQPLTGVLADRHLTSAKPTFPEVAAKNRAELMRTSPRFIVDGLGPLNPALAIEAFEDLRPWLNRYERIGQVRTAVVYRLHSQSNGSQ